MTQSPEFLGSNLKTVIVPPQRRGESLRSSEAVIIGRTGRSRCNMAATALIDSVATRTGLSLDRFALRIAVNEEQKILALFPVAYGTAGSLNLHRTPERDFVWLNLASVFRQYPSLKLGGEYVCPIMTGVDATGNQCVYLTLQNAVPRRKGQRSSRALSAVPSVLEDLAPATEPSAETESTPTR
jgi:hypothetical protein